MWSISHVRVIAILNLAMYYICAASRILAVFPLPFREHQIVYHPLVEALANGGHQLVVVTTDPLPVFHPNIKQIDLSFIYSLHLLDDLKDTRLSGSEMLKTVFDVIRTVSNEELKSEPVQALLADPTQRFDAVLVEWSGASLMNAFAYKYAAPLIALTNGGAFMNSHEAFGNPNHPVAYPSMLLPFSEDLSLLQRIASAVFTVWYRYMYFSEELPMQNAMARHYFGESLPDLWQLERDADLMLVNAYTALGNARATSPTTVYLGGLHARDAQPLPVDLQAFIERCDCDVVYVNVGTDPSFLMSMSRVQKIIRAIEALHMNIVWNLDGALVANASVQIYQLPDLPQEEILAHTRVKLFITNGGQRNVEDAIHHGVPVFGVSFSSYLEHYLRQIQKHAAGVVSMIDFESEEHVVAGIRSAIKNSSYLANIKRLNHLLHDRPLSSVETAIWWIEYVLRNGGTGILQTSMKKMGWYEYLMLDILVTISISLSTVVIILFYGIRKLINYSKSLPIERVTRGSKAKVL